MAAFDVVEVVDIVGHGPGQFQGGRPFAGVEELDLQAGPEGFHGGVVIAVADGAEGGEQPQRRTFSPKLQDVNCVPWSACTIVEPQRFLLATAMLTALLTSAVSGVVENVRATIIRENQSRMAQQ